MRTYFVAYQIGASHNMQAKQCYKNQKKFHTKITVFDSKLLKEILTNAFVITLDID